MKLLKIIAHHEWLRLAVGGVVSGGVAYGLVHAYPAIAWFAVAGAVVIGAISSLAMEHLPESVVKAVMAAVLVQLAVTILPRTMANDPSWWRIGFTGLAVGFLVGMGVGSLVGGVCRSVWVPDFRGRKGD
jgi:hypothetical protein